MLDSASSWIQCKIIHMRGDDARFIDIGIRNVGEEKKGYFQKLTVPVHVFRYGLTL